MSAAGRRLRAGGGGIVLLSALLSGCAPTTSHLLATRQYGEAVCAAAVHPGDPSRLRVLDAVLADAAPELYVRAVGEDEMVASLGARGRDIHRDFAIVIVALSTNTLDVPDDYAVRFVDGGRALPLRPANGQTFAALTGERLPLPRTIVDSEGRLARLGRALDPSGKSVAETFGGTAAGILEIVTLGLVPFTALLSTRPDRYETRYPTDAERLAQAPAAVTLDAGMRKSLDSIPRVWKPQALVFPRPKGIPTLEVAVSLTPHAPRRTCRLDATLAFELPPAPTFEGSVQRAFPEGARALLPMATRVLEAR